MNNKRLKNPSTIRIDPLIKQWLLRLAFVEKRTLSNMINKILSEYKEQKEKE